MSLRVLGAGLPRTATSSLRQALQQLLDAPCCHMSAIPGHPCDLGPDWRRALAGQPVAWRDTFAGYAAAVDWPTSLFWREIHAVYPDAMVLLSERDSPELWWESMDATVLAAARDSPAGCDLVALLRRFTGSADWDDPDQLTRAYERHVSAVIDAVPPEKLLRWRPADGWEPLCRALGVDVPDQPFPWRNLRGDWS